MRMEESRCHDFARADEPLNIMVRVEYVCEDIICDYIQLGIRKVFMSVPTIRRVAVQPHQLIWCQMVNFLTGNKIKISPNITKI